MSSRFSMNNGADTTSSQTIGVKTRRSTSEWHKFFIQTLIDVILTSLEIFLCVDYHDNVWLFSGNVLPPTNIVWFLKTLSEGFRLGFTKLGPTLKMVLWAESSTFSTLNASKWMKNKIMIQFRSSEAKATPMSKKRKSL